MVLDASGNIFVADSFNFVIKKIDTSGAMSVFAGSLGNSGSDDGQGTAAKFTYPWGMAIDSRGNLYVADYGGHTIRKISPTGLVSTLAGTAGAPGSSDGTGAGAKFKYPSGLATDSSGNIYVADTSNNAIRKITPSGVVTTLAGRADLTFGAADGALADARFNAPRGIAVDSSGTIYIADYGNNALRRIKYVPTP
jgi:sugar lactone lactonase YvrE